MTRWLVKKTRHVGGKTFKKNCFHWFSCLWLSNITRTVVLNLWDIIPCVFVSFWKGPLQSLVWHDTKWNSQCVKVNQKVQTVHSYAWHFTPIPFNMFYTITNILRLIFNFKCMFVAWHYDVCCDVKSVKIKSMTSLRWEEYIFFWYNKQNAEEKVRKMGHFSISKRQKTENN